MSAHGLFTDQQWKIYNWMIEWGDAEHIAKELGLSRSRVVEIFYKCLRKISTVIALKQTQEKWDKLEDENRQLNVLVATLRQQVSRSGRERHNLSEKCADLRFYSYLCGRKQNGCRI